LKSSSAPEELKGFTTYHDAIENVFKEGNATVQLPSMLLLLYELTM
jgi:hypothetical protein